MTEGRLKHLIRELAFHIGEGVLEDFDEEEIIAIEEKYLERGFGSVHEHEMRFLERKLRFANAQ